MRAFATALTMLASACATEDAGPIVTASARVVAEDLSGRLPDSATLMAASRAFGPDPEPLDSASIAGLLAAGLPLYRDEQPPRPRAALLWLSPLSRVQGDEYHLTATVLLPYMEEEGAVHSDELTWEYRLRCDRRECSVLEARLTMQALWESGPAPELGAGETAEIPKLSTVPRPARIRR